MRAYIETQGNDIWDALENGSFVSTSLVNGVGTSNIKSFRDEDDKKKDLYDKKEKNMLQPELGMDEVFRVSQCQTTK